MTLCANKGTTREKRGQGRGRRVDRDAHGSSRLKLSFFVQDQNLQRQAVTKRDRFRTTVASRFSGQLTIISSVEFDDKHTSHFRKCMRWLIARVDGIPYEALPPNSVQPRRMRRRMRRLLTRCLVLNVGLLRQSSQPLARIPRRSQPLRSQRHARNFPARVPHPRRTGKSSGRHHFDGGRGLLEMPSKI